MRIWLSLMIGALVVAPHQQVGMLGKGVPTAAAVVASGAHPRLLFTTSGVSAIQSTLSGSKATDFQNLVTSIDTHVTANDWTSLGGYGPGPNGAMNLAFLLATWQVSGITYGHTKAQYLSNLQSLLGTMEATPNNYTCDNDDVALSLAYDWAYNDLSGTDRSNFVTMLKTCTMRAPTNPWHHAISSEYFGYASAGLAFTGDGIDDAGATTRTTELSSGFLATQLSGTNYLAGTNGGVGVGYSYATDGFGDAVEWNDLLVRESWRTQQGTAQNTYWSSGSHAVIEYYPQWLLYLIKPWPGTDGPFVQRTQETDNDVINTSSPFYDSPTLLQWVSKLYSATNPTMASLAQWLIQNYTGTWPATDTGSGKSFKYTILGNLLPANSTTAQSPSALGLPQSKWFDPYGWIAMRSGWSSTSDTVVTFWAVPYDRSAGSYAPSGRAGHFTIDRRGPIATTAGTGLHHFWSDSSFAMNTILFVDPAETGTAGASGGYWDQGGQHVDRAQGSSSITQSAFTPGSVYDYGGLKSGTSLVDLYTGSSHDYNYIEADISRAYNGTGHNDGNSNTNKVSQFIRQLVYFPTTDATDPLKPDFVIVYDRTTTEDSKFQKRWLYHPPGRSDKTQSFTISGHSGTTTVTRNGHGNTSYTQPTLVTITSTDRGSLGKAWMVPHLPASRNIVVAGGPDGSGNFFHETGTTTSHEFDDPYGVLDTTSNIPGSSFASLTQFIGQYTLELQPASAATSDTFMVSFEVANSSGSSQSTTETLSGTNFEGVRIGPRIAIFGKTSLTGTSGSFTVPSAGTYRMLISGLNPSSSRTISCTNTSVLTTVSGGTGSPFTVSAQGTVYLNLTNSASAVCSIS